VDGAIGILRAENPRRGDGGGAGGGFYKTAAGKMIVHDLNISAGLTISSSATKQAGALHDYAGRFS